MGPAPVRNALRRSLDSVRHISPVRPGAADELVGRVYQQAERDFGMLAPPVALHSPAPGPLAASWLMLRESLLADGLVPRASKEGVAAAVSLGNECPYCVAVHSATISGLLSSNSAAAVANDQLDSIADPAVRAAARWARHTGDRELSRSQAVPFGPEQLPELVGVAVTFHYLNRMANVFLLDSPLPPGVPEMARGGALRMLGRFMSRTARQPHQAGAALELLPPAPLPPDLAWASGNRSVEQAFARAAFAIEEAGQRWVPAGVRELLSARLADWDGQAMGLSRSWALEATRELAAVDRPAGRLALLTALASYQVDQSVIDEFRVEAGGDEALVGLTAWASMAAARRIGSWVPIR